VVELRLASFKIDLHVHTGRYSQCAEAVDPFQLESYSLRAGLAGVVIVEHDMYWQDEELQLLQQASPGIKVYRGIEVSARDCHLVVIGMEEPALLERGSSLEEVVAQTHRQNGVVILAHPYRYADPNGLPVQLVDAVEVASTSFTREEARLSRSLARRFDRPTVAASDAHALTCIGWAWTELPFLPGDESALARAISDGLGRASAPSRFAGDPKEL
jgi:predicted metal-dependent phosphoesterase TrpH